MNDYRALQDRARGFSKRSGSGKNGRLHEVGGT